MHVWCNAMKALLTWIWLLGLTRGAELLVGTPGAPRRLARELRLEAHASCSATQSQHMHIQATRLAQPRRQIERGVSCTHTHAPSFAFSGTAAAVLAMVLFLVCELFEWLGNTFLKVHRLVLLLTFLTVSPLKPYTQSRRKNGVFSTERESPSPTVTIKRITILVAIWNLEWFERAAQSH